MNRLLSVYIKYHPLSPKPQESVSIVLVFHVFLVQPPPRLPCGPCMAMSAVPLLMMPLLLCLDGAKPPAGAKLLFTRADLVTSIHTSDAAPEVVNHPALAPGSGKLIGISLIVKHPNVLAHRSCFVMCGLLDAERSLTCVVLAVFTADIRRTTSCTATATRWRALWR